MLSTETALSPDWVKVELRRLRQGPGLAHPTTVMRLDERLRRLIIGDLAAASAADQVVRLVGALRRAIGRLDSHERPFALVDFNLAAEHSYPTLTDRQESLAQERRCAVKTVRRHSDRALDTLALIVALGDHAVLAWREALPAGYAPIPAGPSAGEGRWQRALCAFWQLTPGATADVICSEIPVPERPASASLRDRNYLRYAKFADIDSLIYIRDRLARACPDLSVRDFASSEYFGTDADCMIVIGGPLWNAKFRDFLPHLPFHFAPGEGSQLVIPELGGLRLAPRWTARRELLEDLAVFTRLTLARGVTVFLLAGCLSVGVLAAAQCFLHGELGAANAGYVGAIVGAADFVLVVEARRVGGITDVADLASNGPLLLLARRAAGTFEVLADRTGRYPRIAPGAGREANPHCRQPSAGDHLT